MIIKDDDKYMGWRGRWLQLAGGGDGLVGGGDGLVGGGDRLRGQLIKKPRNWRVNQVINYAIHYNYI